MPDDDYLKRSEERIERRFEAPPARVYAAWTEPDLLARWIWASLGQAVWAERDLRVGGAYRVYSKVDGGTHQGPGWSGMCGLYVALEPDRKLVYTLHWDADVGYNRPGMLALDEVVSVSLEPDGEGTRMTFVHMGIPDDGQSAPTHRIGTEESFDMLAEVLGMEERERSMCCRISRQRAAGRCDGSCESPPTGPAGAFH